MSDVDRTRPDVPAPAGPWSHLIELSGTELVDAVHRWFEASAVPLDDVSLEVAEGGPVHGYSPAMLDLGEEDRLTVLVVSPFPGAEQNELHTVVPHPDIVSAARRRHIRITRAWDLLMGDPEFAQRLVKPGEGGFMTADG